MIIFMVVAIVVAKSKIAWIFYAIGAILQLMSLAGNQKIASVNGTDITLDWIVYFFLLIVVAIIMIARYNSKKSITSEKTMSLEQACICDMCGHNFEKLTYSKITDDMGVRYRNMCDACLEIHNATPVGKNNSNNTTKSQKNNNINESDTKFKFEEGVEDFSTATESVNSDSINASTQIRFCRKCGNKLLNNALFCTECGTKIIVARSQGENSIDE
jgi:hypothetical protein